MTKKRFADMNETEFDSLIDRFIDRTEKNYGEVPSEIFLDLLVERVAAQVDETVNLSINITGEDLTITPDRDMGNIIVRGNEILVGKHRFVLQLTG
jgi:predicted transcriptional regulator